MDLSGDEGTVVNPIVLRQSTSPVLPGAHNPDLGANQLEMTSSRTPQGPMASSTQGIKESPSLRPSIATAFSSLTVHASPDSSNRTLPPSSELKNANVKGDAYRQKVEALKNEVGNTWLNVLNDDGWHDHGKSKLDPSETKDTWILSRSRTLS